MRILGNQTLAINCNQTMKTLDKSRRSVVFLETYALKTSKIPWKTTVVEFTSVKLQVFSLQIMKG